MKHLSEIPLVLGSVSPSESSEPSPHGGRPKDPDDRDRVDNLWAHMTRMFGDRWTSRWGSVPEGGAAAVWLEGLRQIGNRQIKVGIRCCLYSTSPFPPTVGQFVALIHENDSASHRPFPRNRRLQQLAASEETSREHIKRMRAMLGGTEHPNEEESR